MRTALATDEPLVPSDLIHLRATSGRFLLVCRAMGTSTNWRDTTEGVTCPRCRRLTRVGRYRDWTEPR